MNLALKIMAAAGYLFASSALFASTPCSDLEPFEKSLSCKFAEYFSGKDLGRMASLLDEDITVYDPGKVTKGKENFLNLLKSNFDKTNTIVFEPTHIYQEGNTTILEFKLSFDNDQYKGVDMIVWKHNKIDEFVVIIIQLNNIN